MYACIFRYRYMYMHIARGYVSLWDDEGPLSPSALSQTQANAWLLPALRPPPPPPHACGPVCLVPASVRSLFHNPILSFMISSVPFHLEPRRLHTHKDPTSGFENAQ